VIEQGYEIFSGKRKGEVARHKTGQNEESGTYPRYPGG